MINQTFVMPRRGWLGNKPVGADYMREIEARAKRLKDIERNKPVGADYMREIEARAKRLKDIERTKPVKDKRQLRLPGC